MASITVHQGGNRKTTVEGAATIHVRDGHLFAIRGSAAHGDVLATFAPGNWSHAEVDEGSN